MNARLLIESDDIKRDIIASAPRDIVSVVFVHRRSNKFVTSNMSLSDTVQGAVKFETPEEAIDWANHVSPGWEDRWIKANISWSPK